MRPRLLLGACCLLGLLCAPTPAAAVETGGRGANISHVRNIPYPDLHEPEKVNLGTDLEFATIRVAPPRVCVRARRATRPARKRALRRRCRAALRTIPDAQPDVHGVQKTFAFAGSYGDGLHEESRCVTDLRAKGFTIDPDTGGTFIADITNPYAPAAVSFVGLS